MTRRLTHDRLLWLIGLAVCLMLPSVIQAAGEPPPPTAGRVWGDAVAQRWVPVILSGLALAALNQRYWRLRYQKQVARLRLQKMIDTYSAISSDLSTLINRLNQMVEIKKGRATNKREELEEVQEQMTKCAADLALEFAAVKLYFKGKADGSSAAIMSMIQVVSSEISGGEKLEYIKVGHPLFEAAMNLQEELRRALRHALNNDD